MGGACRAGAGGAAAGGGGAGAAAGAGGVAAGGAGGGGAILPLAFMSRLFRFALYKRKLPGDPADPDKGAGGRGPHRPIDGGGRRDAVRNDQAGARRGRGRGG